MNRIGWSIALIFSAALALYLPSWLENDDRHIQKKGDAELIPNYQAVNLNSKLYDKEGKLSHQMAAEKMEHFEELGFTVFTQPVYTLYLDSGEPWQVTAREATLHDDNRIQLENNVKIVNLRTEEFVREIKTEFIEINLQDKTLVSDQMVEINGLDYSVSSVGLFGDLNTQQYEFKEHVQTQFSPAL